MKKKVSKNKISKKTIFILIRYVILLVLMFSILPYIYRIFTPLTVYSTAFLLGLFYKVVVYDAVILIRPESYVQVIPACVAGSAYLLLLILNLTVSMEIRKRIYSIIFSFIILFIVNVLRISLLSALYHEKYVYFDFTHAFFWYFLSTVFVVLIWFLTVKIFSINKIPVYSDLKTISNKSKN